MDMTDAVMCGVQIVVLSVAMAAFTACGFSVWAAIPLALVVGLGLVWLVVWLLAQCAALVGSGEETQDDGSDGRRNG